MLFRKSKPADAADPSAIKPEESTAIPSENVSVSDMSAEKEKEAHAANTDSRSISSSKSKRKVETTGLDGAKALDKLEEEEEEEEEEIVYPTGAKLAFITFALCLSVFLMALVCVTHSSVGCLEFRGVM